MTEQTFQAVCGQKCGPVTVPSLETTHCPICKNPLTGAPTVAGEASVGDQSAIPAAATGEVIAGAPVVTVLPPATAAPVSLLQALALDPAVLGKNLSREEKVGGVKWALELMGYASAQAGELAENAMGNLEAQPPAGAAQAAG